MSRQQNYFTKSEPGVGRVLSFLVAKARTKRADISLSVRQRHLHRRRWPFHPVYVSLLLVRFIARRKRYRFCFRAVSRDTPHFADRLSSAKLIAEGCSDLPQTRQLFFVSRFNERVRSQLPDSKNEDKRSLKRFAREILF